MGSFNLTVVFLLLIIKLSSCSDHHTSVLKCIQTEREALLSVKEGINLTHEYDWRSHYWLGEDCCQWAGVECNNKSGHVTKLDVRGFQFNEQISSLDWLSGLSSLKYLDMGGVDLSGVGAYWLHAVNRLPSLVELHLDHCKLQSLPTSLLLVNLTSLSVLDLSYNHFNSSIPQWLVNLTSLTKLDLRFNYFQDTIPFDFVNLRNLRDLYLSGNRYITGQLPSFAGNLCKLRTLDLSQMNFCGTIDGFLGNASACLNKSLESLDLSVNNLLGKIPDSLGRLGSLRYLNLEYNSFWGSIPASIGSLSCLQDLDLSNNEMNGTIPESFGQLSNLVNLFLYENFLEGVITEVQLMNLTRLENVILKANTNHSLVFNVTYDWVPPFKLKILELESCLCGPKFPIWLQVQSELTVVTLKNVGIIDTIPEEWFSMISSQIIHFDLSQNQIMGKLPHQLVLPNVNFIDLSNNCFKGPIPLWFSNVTELYLKSNSFSGSIPSNIDDLMPRLRCLDLSENNLNGTIPLSIWKINDLGGLYLRSNKLSGGLPHHWNESQLLWVVDISYNNLSGKILSSMGLLSSLHVLVLSNNNLYGEIPSSLQNCSLVSLDLSGNHLSGILPSWIGSEVKILRLRSNQFSGIIPRQWCNLPALHILDVAQNNLFGRIPNCLGNFSALIYGNGIIWPSFYVNYVEKAIIMTKGRELEYGSTLQFVTTIDFSGNNLIGGIPDEITSLTALDTLNLSRNHLTGNVPKNIGNMRFLETLDLSKNSLSGPIPESMSSLTSLVHLNLSFNKLAGRIPSGNQLQTLNDASIYKGNTRLCGSPLPTKCPGDETFDGPTFSDGSGIAEDKQDGDDAERLWFIVSIGLGFVVGFWSVCGTLLVFQFL
ncbi:hypothetical protein ACB094_05G209200 [Castanea mollissima]